MRRMAETTRFQVPKSLPSKAQRFGEGSSKFFLPEICLWPASRTSSHKLQSGGVL
jgi:hypothetical protein